MSTNQENRHYTFKELHNPGGSAVKLEEDHLQGYVFAGAVLGAFNETRLDWINKQLVPNYNSLPEAMQAYAENQGFTNWSSIGGKIATEPPLPVYGTSGVAESGTTVRVGWDVAIAGGITPEAGFTVYRERFGGFPAEQLTIADGTISTDVLTLTISGAVIELQDIVFVDYDSGPGGIKRADGPGQATSFYGFRVPNGSQQGAFAAGFGQGFS